MNSDDEDEEDEEMEEENRNNVRDASDSDDASKDGDSDSEDDIVSKIRKERGLLVRDKQPTITSVRTGHVQKKKIKMSMGTEGGRITSRNDGKKSFAARLKSESSRVQREGHKVSRTALGGMEMAFTPKSKKNNRR